MIVTMNLLRGFFKLWWSPFTLTKVHPNSDASLNNSRLVYRLGIGQDYYYIRTL